MGIKEKRLLDAVKFLESKDVDIFSRADVLYKRALFIAADVDPDVLENIQKSIDKNKK